MAFVESLCAQPQDTLIAVHRSLRGWQWCARPFGRCGRATAQKPARAFSFFEVEGEDEPGEAVDLIRLAGRERK